MNKKSSRRDEILQAFASMLEATPGGRITTAALARQVGVSEAALYRHFPSKARMFEGLIDFIETSVFSRISRIRQEEADGVQQCEQTLTLLLTFCLRNAGISRLLTGDALTGETERLHARVLQFFDRFETELKQILRDAELRQGLRTTLPIALAANLLLATAEGRISQFVRSGFRRSPVEYWPEQWRVLGASLFRQNTI